MISTNIPICSQWAMALFYYYFLKHINTKVVVSWKNRTEDQAVLNKRNDAECFSSAWGAMQKRKFHRWGQSNRGLNPQNLLQGLLHTLEKAEKQYTLRQTVITFKKNGGVNILILRNETKILLVFHWILSSWICYSKYSHKQLFLLWNSKCSKEVLKQTTNFLK